jgi:hypothetical protein
MFGLLQIIFPLHYPFRSMCKSVEKITVPNQGVLRNVRGRVGIIGVNFAKCFYYKEVSRGKVRASLMWNDIIQLWI